MKTKSSRRRRGYRAGLPLRAAGFGSAAPRGITSMRTTGSSFSTRCCSARRSAGGAEWVNQRWASFAPAKRLMGKGIFGWSVNRSAASSRPAARMWAPCCREISSETVRGFGVNATKVSSRRASFSASSSRSCATASAVEYPVNTFPAGRSSFSFHVSGLPWLKCFTVALPVRKSTSICRTLALPRRSTQRKLSWASSGLKRSRSSSTATRPSLKRHTARTTSRSPSSFWVSSPSAMSLPLWSLIEGKPCRSACGYRSATPQVGREKSRAHNGRVRVLKLTERTMGIGRSERRVTDRQAAGSFSGRSKSEIDGLAGSRADGLLMDGHRGCHVLEGRSRAVEDHDLLVGRAPGLRTRHHLGELGVDACALHQPGVQRMVQLTDGRALFQDIDHHLGRREDRRLQLLFLGAVRADRGDEGPRPDVLGPNQRGSRRSAGYAHVASGDGLRQVGHRCNRKAQLGRQFLRKLPGAALVRVEGEHALELQDAGDGAELHASLDAASTDGRDARRRAGQVLRRHRGSGAGAEDGDLDGVHHGQGPAVFAVAEHDQTLDGGQTGSARIVREIAVHFGSEGAARSRQQRGLDVKASAGHRNSENRGGRQPAQPAQTEGLLDSGDALVQRQQLGYLAPPQQQRGHRDPPGSTSPDFTSSGARPLAKTRAGGDPPSVAVLPSTRIQPPSLSPTTAASFSSRNWRMRSSCVSPMCTDAGSGSR